MRVAAIQTSIDVLLSVAMHVNFAVPASIFSRNVCAIHYLDFLVVLCNQPSLKEGSLSIVSGEPGSSEMRHLILEYGCTRTPANISSMHEKIYIVSLQMLTTQMQPYLLPKFPNSKA